MNPGWFVELPSSDGVNISQPDLCNYFTDKCARPDISARETIRAVAMIYYLNNESWVAGDGGETGLYSSVHDPVSKPTVVVPQINN